MAQIRSVSRRIVGHARQARAREWMTIRVLIRIFDHEFGAGRVGSDRLHIYLVSFIGAQRAPLSRTYLDIDRMPTNNQDRRLRACAVPSTLVVEDQIRWMTSARAVKKTPTGFAGIRAENSVTQWFSDSEIGSNSKESASFDLLPTLNLSRYSREPGGCPPDLSRWVALRPDASPSFVFLGRRR